MTPNEALMLTGRVIKAADGLTYTIQSASTNGEIHVWNPRKNELLVFLSKELYDNFVNGTPVSTN